MTSQLIPILLFAFINSDNHTLEDGVWVHDSFTFLPLTRQNHQAHNTQHLAVWVPKMTTTSIAKRRGRVTFVAFMEEKARERLASFQYWHQFWARPLFHCWKDQPSSMEFFKSKRQFLLSLSSMSWYVDWIEESSLFDNLTYWKSPF